MPSRDCDQIKTACHLAGGVEKVVDGYVSDQNRGDVILTSDPAQERKYCLDVACSSAQRVVKLVEDQHPWFETFQQVIQLFRLAADIPNVTPGGVKRLVAFAIATAVRVPLVVLDEPNANLDQAGEAALSAAIEAMKRCGSTLLIVGHRPSTIAQADKILLLKDGRVELFGPRDEILKRLRIEAAGRATDAAAGPGESQRA